MPGMQAVIAGAHVMDPSEQMHMMLAQVGIFLDKPAEELAPEPEPDWDALAAFVDRDMVRRILRDRGAPRRDLDWLTASCPSLAAAEAFEPTPWMLRDFTNPEE